MYAIAVAAADRDVYLAYDKAQIAYNTSRRNAAIERNKDEQIATATYEKELVAAQVNEAKSLAAANMAWSQQLALAEKSQWLVDNNFGGPVIHLIDVDSTRDNASTARTNAHATARIKFAEEVVLCAATGCSAPPSAFPF